MASVSKRRWSHNGVEKEAWILRYVDLTGAQRQETFKLKRHADARCRVVEGELLTKTHISASTDMTVSAICEAFIRFQEERWNSRIISRYRYDGLRRAIDISVLPTFGKRMMGSLSLNDLLEWHSALVKRGGLCYVTAKSRMAILSLVYKFAIKRGFANKNVALDAMGEIGSSPKAVIRTFTQEQIQHLLACCEKRAYKQTVRSAALLKCMVNLATFCGLRLGEIFALTVKNVDLESRTVHVRHNLTIWDELKGPKTRAGVRDVPMPEHVSKILKEWIDVHMVKDDRGLLFRTSRKGSIGRAFKRSTLHSTYWIPLLLRAGLSNTGDHFHFHALRHFCASYWISNGVSIPDVAAMLGHSKFDETLQTYTHTISNGARRSVHLDRISGALAAAIAPSFATASQEQLTH